MAVLFQVRNHQLLGTSAVAVVLEAAVTWLAVGWSNVTVSWRILLPHPTKLWGFTPWKFHLSDSTLGKRNHPTIQAFQVKSTTLDGFCQSWRSKLVITRPGSKTSRDCSDICWSTPLKEHVSRLECEASGQEQPLNIPEASSSSSSSWSTTKTLLPLSLPLAGTFAVFVAPCGKSHARRTLADHCHARVGGPWNRSLVSKDTAIGVARTWNSPEFWRWMPYLKELWILYKRTH